MGGVDLLDSMLGLYIIHLRSKKWYKYMVFHMVDMCVVNAWILWRRNNPEVYMCLFDFKQAVSEHLRKSGKTVIARKRGRPGNHGKDGTPDSRHGNPALSNPDAPTIPKKITKVPTRHQDVPLNSARTGKVDHMP
ncbi:unnamed protein product [Parnassius apollo]|uniref:(apollo) hypothetical protein n=1 Tax=Parnassius apollo TaxID=110799 RepID=A0A8S3W8L3_PARAO|nr:unnamed protein product [Parnassius apollo]